MFFKTEQPKPEYSSELNDVIASALPNVDDETRHIVVAVTGLLGCVSYADRDFSDSEKGLVAQLLQTIHGVGKAEADAILGALAERIVHVATVEAARHARALKQLGDRDLRLYVLDMLLDVAAADQDISQNEVVVLRQITTSLGLNQSDYNELQSKHRDKLAALK